MSKFLTIPSNINSSVKIKKLPIKTNVNKISENLIINKPKLLSPLSIRKNRNEEIYNEKNIQKYQQNFLNSLLSKSKSRKIIAFDQYNSVLSNSLNHYKSKGLTDEEISEINSIRNEQKNDNSKMDKKDDDTDRDSSSNKFKIKINDFDYKNPYQSLSWAAIRCRSTQSTGRSCWTPKSIRRSTGT